MYEVCIGCGQLLDEFEFEDGLWCLYCAAADDEDYDDVEIDGMDYYGSYD